MILERNIYAAVFATLMVLFGCWPLSENYAITSVVVGVALAAICSAITVQKQIKAGNGPVEGFGLYLLAIAAGYIGATISLIPQHLSLMTLGYALMAVFTQPTGWIRLFAMILSVVGFIFMLRNFVGGKRGRGIIWTLVMCIAFMNGFNVYLVLDWNYSGLPWLLELFALALLFLFVMRTGIKRTASGKNLAIYVALSIWITVRPVFLTGYSIQGAMPWSVFLLDGLFSPVSLVMVTVTVAVAVIRVSDYEFNWWNKFLGKWKSEGDAAGERHPSDRDGLYDALLWITMAGMMWLVNFVLRYPVLLRWAAPIAFFLLAMRTIRRFGSGSLPAFHHGVVALIAYAVVCGLAIVLTYHAQYLLFVSLVVLGLMVRHAWNGVRSDIPHVMWFWVTVLLFVGVSVVAATVVRGFTISKTVFIVASLIIAVAAMLMSLQNESLSTFDLAGIQSRAFVFAAIKAAMVVAFTVVVGLAALGGPKPASIEYADPSLVSSNVVRDSSAGKLRVQVDHPEQVESLRYQTSETYVSTYASYGHAQRLDSSDSIIDASQGRHVVVWVTYKDGTVCRTDRWVDMSMVQFDQVGGLTDKFLDFLLE